MNKWDLTTAEGWARWWHIAEASGFVSPIEPKFNPLMAYIEARQGNPEGLLELLRDVGLDEFADDIENGEIKIPVGKEGDLELLDAAIEFRKLDQNTDWEADAARTRRGPTAEKARQLAMEKIAIKHGVLADKLRLFVVRTEGGHYRRLKKYLPEDLFPKIKRD